MCGDVWRYVEMCGDVWRGTRTWILLPTALRNREGNAASSGRHLCTRRRALGEHTHPRHRCLLGRAGRAGCPLGLQLCGDGRRSTVRDGERRWWTVMEGGGRWWTVRDGDGRWWTVRDGDGRWWTLMEGGGRWWTVMEGGGRWRTVVDADGRGDWGRSHACRDSSTHLPPPAVVFTPASDDTQRREWVQMLPPWLVPRLAMARASRWRCSGVRVSVSCAKREGVHVGLVEV